MDTSKKYDNLVVGDDSENQDDDSPLLSGTYYLSTYMYIGTSLSGPPISLLLLPLGLSPSHLASVAETSTSNTLT
jgi:hypothetical protein